MILVDALKAAVLLLVVAVLQLTFVNSFELVEGHADVLLLGLAGLALLRGPIFGACAGFFAGLVIDVAMLGTLGLTSLLLTVAGYAAGRLGEVTSSHTNQRARIVVAAALLTVGVGVGALIVHGLLGEPVSVGTIVSQSVVPSLALNVLLAVPSYWVCRKLFPPPPKREREVVVV